MKDKIDIGAIGTFGLPNGCTQSAFYSGKFKKNKSLDLNANEIKVFPNTNLFAIRREVVDNQASLLFVKYTFAKEKNSNRGGTFLGSCICFYDSYAIPNQICSLLNEFHHHLIDNKHNILNSVLQVSHSRDLQVKLPKDFDKLDQNLKSFTGESIFSKNISSNSNFLVYANGDEENKLVKFFQNCMEHFPNNETIYFTDSREIAEFAFEKQLLKVQQFEEFEKDIESIKIRLVEEQRRLEEFKKAEENRIEEKRREEERKIEQDRIIEEQKKREVEDRKRILSVRGFPNQHQPIKSEVHRKLVTDYNALLQIYGELEFSYENLKANSNANFYGKEPVHRTNEKVNSTTRKSIFYIVIPALCVVLILSNLYLLFFQKPEIEFKEITVYRQPETNVLTPLPNGELSQTKRQLLFKNTMKGKKIGDIVKIIFEVNTPEISGVYFYQQTSYRTNLYRLNEKYFEIEKDTICISDTIGQIPVFKIHQ